MTEINSFDFILPLPQKVSSNSIYAGIHFSKRLRIKENFGWAVKIALASKGKMTFKKPVNLFFFFRFKSRPLDCTNCFFMAKMIEDSLVSQGVLEDDSPKHVHKISIKSKKHDGPDCVLVFLSEVV